MRPPTACKHTVSGTISLPSLGFFSPFPHGTGSLSVFCEYLALPDGPGGFRQGFTCPALLRIPLSITLVTHTGLSPSLALLSSNFRFLVHKMSWSYNPSIAVTTLVWANPRSLATTYGITFVFFSSAYLDVSVQRVCLLFGYYVFNIVGCPIQVSTDQFVCANPRSFSQLITPFIASESQGIPHTPLFCLCAYNSFESYFL